MVVGGLIALLWTAQIASDSSPAWLKEAGIVFLIAWVPFAWRWGTVRVVVTSEGVHVRGVWSTREWPWSAIGGITTDTSIWIPTSTGSTEVVVFQLTNGSREQPLALIRKAADARAIANRLNSLRGSPG